jgi:hypothetical protein
MADPAQTRDLDALIDELEVKHCLCGAERKHRDVSTWAYCWIHRSADELRAATERIRQQAYAQAIGGPLAVIKRFMGNIPFGETKDDQPETRVSMLIRLRDEIKELPPPAIPQARGETSDGYHTFNELYEHRHALFSVICADHGGWKSKLHSDGTMFEGWFIAGVLTPLGQATYHLPLSWWDRFRCKELERGPEWDGHIAQQVPERIAAIPGERERLTGEKLREIAKRNCVVREVAWAMCRFNWDAIALKVEAFMRGDAIARKLEGRSK